MPKPTPKNQKLFARWIELVGELMSATPRETFNAVCGTAQSVLEDEDGLDEYTKLWEHELAITVWNANWAPEYRKKNLSKFKKHGRDNFERHNKYTPDKTWVPPVLAEFRNKGGRPPASDTEATVVDGGDEKAN